MPGKVTERRSSKTERYGAFRHLSCSSVGFFVSPSDPRLMRFLADLGSAADTNMPVLVATQEETIKGRMYTRLLSPCFPQFSGFVLLHTLTPPCSNASSPVAHFQNAERNAGVLAQARLSRCLPENAQVANRHGLMFFHSSKAI